MEWLAQLESELSKRQKQREQIERIEERAAEELIARHAAIAQRLAAYPRPGHIELADELARVANWAEIDTIRMKHDLSPAVAVSIILQRDPLRAIELMGQFSRQRA
jgi:hypothetical protein